MDIVTYALAKIYADGIGERLGADIAALSAIVNEIAASISEEYDPTLTYEAGKLIRHDSKLYRANVDITAPEAWTPEHWTEVDLEDEIAAIKAALADRYTKGEADTLLAGKVSVEPQTLTDEQKAQARENIGAYTKPAGGIPETDLDSGVQESLDKADTALQEVPDTYRTAAAQDVIDANMADDQSLVDNFSYEGVDLGVKFADEIAAAPYNGDPAAWIKGRIRAKNYKGLHLRDYFTITCANGTIIKPQIMGINTYKGSAATEIGDHIDFISKDCWPGAVQYNPVNYNNGIGLDKFTGDGATTVFQLCHRSATTFPALSKVTIGGADAATDTYAYDATTGVLAFNEAPASGAVIKAVWATPITLPFLASKVRAFLMSEKAGVPNEAAADPALIEVDYTNGGVWKNIPDNWKAVIVDKWSYPGVRYTAGSLRTSENDWTSQNLGKLWLPDECEVYGCAKFGHSYAAAYGRMYPGFLDGNRRKGDGNGASRTYWWLLPANSGNSTYFCYVSGHGTATSRAASLTYIRVPVCFRVTG